MGVTPMHDPMPPAKRTVWPMVMGIIAAIFGGLAMFGYLCLGPIWIFLQPRLTDAFEQAAQNQPGASANLAQMRSMEEMSGLLLASNLTAGVVGVVLFVSGIGLIKRRAWCRPALFTWAVLRALYSLPALWLGFKIQEVQMDAMRDGFDEAQAASNKPMPTGMLDILENMTGVFMVLGLVWAWALPVFVLVWFNRRVIREEVRSWRGASPGELGAGA